MSAQDKIYLEVPYPEKDRAKNLGARWDPIRRKWYVAGTAQLTPFREWLPPDLRSEVPAPNANPEEGETNPSAEPRGIALSAFLGWVAEAVALKVPRSQWVRAEIIDILLGLKAGDSYGAQGRH
jgi:exodeoxyribonuclease VII large subunit